MLVYLDRGPGEYTCTRVHVRVPWYLGTKGDTTSKARQGRWRVDRWTPRKSQPSLKTREEARFAREPAAARLLRWNPDIFKGSYRLKKKKKTYRYRVQYEQKNANICATFSKFHLFIEAFLNVIRTAGWVRDVMGSGKSWPGNDSRGLVSAWRLTKKTKTDGQTDGQTDTITEPSV